MKLFKAEGTIGIPAGTFIYISFGVQAIVSWVAIAGKAHELNSVVSSKHSVLELKHASGGGKIVIVVSNVFVSQEFIAESSTW